MVNFFKENATNTISIYPESSSLYYNNDSGSFEIQLTQDYDQSETSLFPSLLNVPTQFSPRLTLQVSSSEVPSYTGLYSLTLLEYINQQIEWAQQNTIWSATHLKWSDISYKSGSRTLDIDRAFVSGSDVPVFIQYTTSSQEYIYGSGSIIPATIQYASPDETGAYITYNN
tara:strand:+ start:4580 stop:5092 length:513 start_codon:yes stop_codon:yes gene_type:complete